MEWQPIEAKIAGVLEREVCSHCPDCEAWLPVDYAAEVIAREAVRLVVDAIRDAAPADLQKILHPAQRIEARSDEIPQEARPEGREPDGVADAP